MKINKRDAILLFEVGHMLIQIINRSILLFKGLSKHNPNSKDYIEVISTSKFGRIFELEENI